MNHKIKFPPRTMLVAGRMRSGKTTLARMYAAANCHPDRNTVLVITERHYLKEAEGEVSAFEQVEHSRAKFLAFDTRFEKDFPSPKDLRAVIITVDAVYSGPDTVLVYEKPSSALLKFLDKLDDPFVQEPYILVTCHMPGAIEHMIQQR